MKGLWKQSGLAGMACADVGSLGAAAAGRSRRRARLMVYGFAVAFAAFTAYVAFSSSSPPGGAAGEGAAGEASWFGGVYASTAPYRAQVSSFFSSIFPSNYSTPSPEEPPRRDGGSSEGGGQVSSHGIDEHAQVGNGAVHSIPADPAASTKLLGSGGGAPSNNAGGGSTPPPGNLAGTGTPPTKGSGSDGGGAPANNSTTSGAPASSTVDRSSPAEDGRGSPTTTSSSARKSSSGKAESVDKSNKQSENGSEAPSNGDAVSDEKGSTAKAETKAAVGVGESNDNSTGTGSSAKGDSNNRSNSSVGGGSGVTSSVSAAVNSTAVKADAKDAVVATSTDSAGSVSDMKANLNNGSDAQSGSGSGDANHASDATVSPAKGNAKDGGTDTNKASGNVASTNNQTASPAMVGKKESGSPSNNQIPVASTNLKNQNQTGDGVASGESGGTTCKQKETTSQGSVGSSKDHPAQAINSKTGNYSEVLVKGNGSSTKQASTKQPDKKVDWIKEMASCDLFHGNWVRDESYPLYPEGSCPHIDEPFDCYLNGRLDRAYQKLRWKPSGCSIPRLNPTDMLERLRGKRLVYVGDSLNRNMWESLVCILRNSVKDKRKVFEASGRHEFKTEGSYSFLFTDYNCSVEFFRSPFLVQEWEMKVSNGKKKETLRLDIVEQSSPKYKDADFLIFNTGHWWTHEKTSLGKDYYQEGNHIYSELNVVDAFHKALVTWSRWIDANVNPKKTTVLFRGYSASHFSGGQWNSGGSCDKETEPIRNEQYLSTYPPKMRILEDVIHKMKTPVVYLNITRMTDYRKDAHPSIYRKRNLTEEERRSPERYQDCSHWCLPGVPDSWNELLYAQLLIKQHQMLQQ
ncbi:hypothetical protein E2562_018088 [Oryza meyeriana var. granulata]|uniref:Uncharacterized protein n=1 Tax=Oryza meyeriana var. granulata TaxID=110450 RepID=A0A6G1CRV9_9ORYZ|nr:hypothetical protein E2562_018088 [Oryza meyeriana var. granulata]